MHFWDPSQWEKMYFEYQRTKFQWKKWVKIFKYQNIRFLRLPQLVWFLAADYESVCCSNHIQENAVRNLFTESVRKHKKLNFKSLYKWNWVTGSFIPTFILAPGDSEDGSTVVVVCSWSWVRKSCCSSWFKVKSWEVSTKKRVTGQGRRVIDKKIMGMIPDSLTSGCVEKL